MQLSSWQMHAKTHTSTVGIVEDQMKLCTQVGPPHRSDSMYNILTTSYTLAGLQADELVHQALFQSCSLPQH